MERAIGEVFELDGVKLRVDKAESWCEGCCLSDIDIDIKCANSRSIRGDCSGVYRSDNTDVIFTEVEE